MPDLPALDPIESIPEIPDVQTLFSTFSDEQEVYKISNGKYEQKLATVVNGNTEEVHEYVCPDGSVGWQAFVTTDISGTTMRKSFGVGPEHESRDHDWVEVIEI